MVQRFRQLGLLDDSFAPENVKRLRWHVDYLLDNPRAELTGIYLLRDSARIEGALGQLLMQDSTTSVIARGLGANDIAGNTHLLRIDADEVWWRLLPWRMQRLTKQSTTIDLIEPYLRGRYCLAPAQMTEQSSRVSFAVGSAARKVSRKLAEQFGVAEVEIIRDAKFATAVGTILGNCGDEAIDAIFSPNLPQARRGIERLARTSDARQRYRVAGVLDRRFRTLAPSSGDAVFDTLHFGEVVSRLARASGLLSKWRQTYRRVPKSAAKDVLRLLDLCRHAASTLRGLLGQTSRSDAYFPPIDRDFIACEFAGITANRMLVGSLKAALKLTVKNCWDFDELARRDIHVTTAQRAAVLDAIEKILAAAEKILQEIRSSATCE